MAVVLAKLYGVERDLETQLKSKGVKDSEDLLARHRAGQRRRCLPLTWT